MQPQRLQSLASVAVVVFGVLALGASTGFTPLPKGNNSWAAFLHPVVLLVGFACGVVTVLRVREIDEERWKLATDDDLTDGERQLAHSNANQEVKVSGTIFLLTALAFGGFLAYQLKVPDVVTAAEFLIVTPMVGFVAGLWLGAKRYPSPEREW